MTNATGIAPPSTPSDRKVRQLSKSIIAALLTSIMLSACGGGAPTTELPDANANGVDIGAGNAPYTGEAARDADILAFQQEFWTNARTTDRCGSCHNETVGQSPMFVRNDNVNLAYDEALTVVDIGQPALSRIVEKVGEGHNCWVADPGVCASILTTWIENWVGESDSGGRQILLEAPPSSDPSDSKNFPEDPSAFANLIHGPILLPYCSNCHSSVAANAQQPYFADPDVDSAYEAAKPKINLDTPANSRLVLRLRNEFHNCWNPPGCSGAAQIMEEAIAAFALGITPTTVEPDLIVSKALRLIDGTLAAGGNRYEDAQIALWEFKTGSGLVAFDTSGVDPAIDLNLSSEVTWFGGWGVTMNGGRAQGTTTASRKLFDILQESGEFSIEAWVIPANVTQEEARIVSYSANDQNRNFTLQQNLYDYQFRLRTNAQNPDDPEGPGMPLSDLNGDPALSTPAADEVLQATLQHVVATYNPVDGRRIYVNGELVTDVDSIPGGTFIDWQAEFALILGSEADGNGQFDGTIRLAAIHRRALTREQVQQNFDVGVGEKFFMLFDISETIEAPTESAYILFEAQQYDSYAYLFDKPHFVTLDSTSHQGIPIEGLRIAMNGQESPVGQTYATLVDQLSTSAFASELGQALSALGAVLPLGKGPEYDEFFLTFDRLHLSSYNRDPDPTLVITETDLPPVPRIGIKTFDEIDATFAAVTEIERTNFINIDMTYQELRQSLPAVEYINTFLSSHQVAIAQLAIAYCDGLIDLDGVTPSGPMFPGFSFDVPNTTAFAVGSRDAFVDPLIDRIMGLNLGSQPDRADVYGELASYQSFDPLGRPDNLIDRLLNPIDPRTGLPPVDELTGQPIPPSNTRGIAKGICAAMLGNAVTLIQ